MSDRQQPTETPVAGADATPHLARRTVLKRSAGLGTLGLLGRFGGEHPQSDSHAAEAAPHTVTTFAAIVDMVVPRTPELAEPHDKGGLDVDAHKTLLTYANTLFQAGVRGGGNVENGRLAEPIAEILDWAATELVARGLNEHPPTPRLRGADTGPTSPEEDPARAPSAGPFAKLHREDRVRTVALADQDKNDVDTAGVPHTTGEGDAGLLAQFAVNITANIYYSESQGYAAGMADWLVTPPSEREFEPLQDFDGDGVRERILSWRQTGFPGPRNGYQALRGYLGRDGSSLGQGRIWTTLDRGDRGPSTRIYFDRGSFEDTDPDTSGYEEVVPEAEWTHEHRLNGDVTSTDPGADSELQGYVDRPFNESDIFDPIRDRGEDS